MKKVNARILEAQRFSFANEESLMNSGICGCFCCCRIFAPNQIEDYVTDTGGFTALCPYCNMDSVLGDASGYPITEEFLREMEKYWF